MKIIKVVAAVICDSLEKPTKFFATARGYGEFKGGWEFPGGKIEPEETPKEAIIREIKEELDTEIIPGKMFYTVEYDYPTFHLSMDCFLAVIKQGDLILKEAEDAKWMTAENIDSVNWLPADLEVVEILKKMLKNNCFDD